MFSVVVSWTNNKDPTSDKGIWLFGTVRSPVQYERLSFSNGTILYTWH